MEGKTQHHALPLGDYKEYSNIISKLVESMELFIDVNLKT